MQKQDLIKALEFTDLQVHYQPQWSSANNRMAGIEALLRWPARSLSPQQFLPLFEAAGLITELADYTLTQVCRDLRELSGESADFDYVAVNYSCSQLLHGCNPGKMLAQVEACGVAPGQLMLEVTENENFASIDALRRVTEELVEAGFGLALDDFCTGYSTVEHICRLPVDAMKIDKSFIRSLADFRSRVVVEQLIKMANRMHINPIAEGVENLQQIKLLKKMGCRTFQGYYYARPMPFDERTTNADVNC